MSATPVVTDHAAVFAALLKPIAPADPQRETIVARLGPWAPHFVEARKKGYSWEQLAAIAAKPEIGVTLPPQRLRRVLTDAMHAANGTAPAHRRHHRKKTVVAAPVPLASTTAAR